MDPQQRQTLLARILAGNLRCKVGGRVYIVMTPTASINYRANELYSEILNEYRWMDDWFSEGQARYLSQKSSKITGNIEANLTELNKAKDDTKVAMFENYLNKDILKQLRKRLELIQQKVNETYLAKHSLDHLTANGFALMIKTQFVLTRTVCDEKENRVWGDEEDVPFSILDAIMGQINGAEITPKDLRELSRTEPWRLYWTCGGKTNPFGKAVANYTEDQLALISYSQMYDSIDGHAECPNDDVIEDDDLLDGWMIMIKRKQDKEKGLKKLESTIPDKYKNSKELYIPVSNQEDANKINELNSAQSQNIKRQRGETVKQLGGKANEMDLPDVRMDLLNLVNQQGR